MKKQIIEKLILLNLVPVGSSYEIIRLREKNPGNAGKILKNGTTLSQNSIYSVYDGKSFCIQILKKKENLNDFLGKEKNGKNVECSEKYLEEHSSSSIPLKSSSYINYSSSYFCDKNNNNIPNNALDHGNNIYSSNNNDIFDNYNSNYNNSYGYSNNNNNNNNNTNNNYNDLNNNNYDNIMNSSENEKILYTFNNNKNPTGLFNRKKIDNKIEIKTENKIENKFDNKIDNKIDNDSNNQVGDANKSIIINDNTINNSDDNNDSDGNIINENIFSSFVLQVQVFERRTFSLGTRYEILLNQNMEIRDITKKLSKLFKIPLAGIRILFVPSNTEINLYDLPLERPSRYSTRAWFDGLLGELKVSDLSDITVCDGDLLLLQNVLEPLRELTEREKMSINMMNMKYNFCGSTVTSMNNNNSFNNSMNNSSNNLNSNLNLNNNGSSNNLVYELYNKNYENNFYSGSSTNINNNKSNNNSYSDLNLNKNTNNNIINNNNNNNNDNNKSSSNNSLHGISSHKSFDMSTYNPAVQYSVKSKRKEKGVHIKTHKDRMLDNKEKRNKDDNKEENKEEIKDENKESKEENRDDEESVASSVFSNTSTSQLFEKNDPENKKIDSCKDLELSLRVQEHLRSSEEPSLLITEEPSLGSDGDILKAGYDIFADLN